jgi:hypothetical protein
MALTKVRRGGTDTGISDSSDATAITIDSSENVGIGTSSPSGGKLHIAHGNEFGLFTSGPFNFQAKFESTDAEAAIVIEDSNSTNDGNRIGVITNDMVFITDDAERARISSSSTKFTAPDGGSRYLFGGTGNSDSAELSLYDSSDAQKVRIGAGVDTFFTGGVVSVGTTSTGGNSILTLSTGNFTHGIKQFCNNGQKSLHVEVGGSEVGSISHSTSSTAFNTSSDYRLKENVVTDWDATSRLKQLKPSRFNFKVDADTTVDGFLAHEVSSVVPEAITGTKDAVDADGNPEYQGIDQSKLVPLLVKTIQELEARITALESK